MKPKNQFWAIVHKWTGEVLKAGCMFGSREMARDRLSILQCPELFKVIKVKVNQQYGEFSEFYSRINDIIKVNKGRIPGPKQLDEILTQLSRTVKVSKSGRTEILKELDKRAGSNFYDKIVANEFMRSFYKQKGIAGSQNAVSAIMRVMDPGKYLALSTTVRPSKAVESTISGVNAIVSGAAKSGSKLSQSATSRIKEILTALAMKIADDKVSQGTRLLYLLMLKELIFPSPNFESSETLAQ